MCKIFLAAVAGNEARGVGVDRQLRDKDQQLLSLAEDFFKECKGVRQLFARGLGVPFERGNAGIEILFQQGEGFRSGRTAVSFDQRGFLLKRRRRQIERMALFG